MLKSFAMVGTILLLTMGAAQAQEAGNVCSTPGSLSFADFPTSRGSIVPSVSRQLANVGLAASKNNCQIVVTCVARTGATQSQRNSRNRQCSAAVQAIVRYETRAPVRTRLANEIEQVRAEAGSGRTVGTVYVTLR